MSDFDLSETVGELENMVNAAWDAGYAKGVDWAKKCGGGIDAMTDAELAERGLVRLPVDADGVTIRVGDTLDGYGKTIEVVEMRYGRSGWVLISRDGNGYADTYAFVHREQGDADATGERQRDAVEVVRCRDCERFAVDQSDHEYRSGWWCKRWDTDMVKPDGFCAWASRKESA